MMSFIESLECRRLLAATAVLNDTGRLTITGTEDSDDIKVEIKADGNDDDTAPDIWFDGDNYDTKIVDDWEVITDSIVIVCGGGHDSVELHAFVGTGYLDVGIAGGAGNDSFFIDNDQPVTELQISADGQADNDNYWWDGGNAFDANKFVASDSSTTSDDDYHITLKADGTDGELWIFDAGGGSNYLNLSPTTTGTDDLGGANVPWYARVWRDNTGTWKGYNAALSRPSDSAHFCRRAIRPVRVNDEGC